MAKYANIEATNLKTIVDECLKELSTYEFTNIKKEVLNNNVLTTEVSETFKNAISLIQHSDKDGSLKTLKENLENIKMVCKNIEYMQNLDREIKNLESRRWKNETREETITEYDIYGKPYEKTREYTVTVEDEGIVAEINRKIRERNEYETKTNSLLNNKEI